MEPRRRYLTFSLRTAFVLFTALAVWLVVVVNRARQQQEAVDAIVKAGGLVAYDATSVRKMTWDHSRHPLFFHCFHTAVGVGLHDASLSDATCAQVARLPRINMLLVHEPVSQRGLNLLTGLKHVESLFLRQGQTADTDFSELQHMESLRILDLGKSQLTDSDLRGLARLKRLFLLRASLTNVSNAGLNYFQRSVPKCHINPSPSQLGGRHLPPADL
jgi:hypothetical protein